MHISEAIQVVWSLDKSGYEHEYNGLKEAMQLHNLKHGLIITGYPEDAFTGNDDTVQIIPAWKWLLENRKA